MAKNLDKVLVIDLESTCWDGNPPEGETSEIIEIGLCVLDTSTGERSAPRAILIKPERSSLSHFCIHLTTLTPEMLSGGISFQEACLLLKNEYQSLHHTWASYGDYDRIQFLKQCESWGIPYPFGRTHINVKNLIALYLGLDHEVDLPCAMKLIGTPFEGTIHRGMDDAWNIAAVLSRVLMARSR